jgi:CRP-like cAMP-binding protein
MTTTENSLSVFRILQPVFSDRIFDLTNPDNNDDIDEIFSIHRFGPNRLVFEEGTAPASVWIIAGGKAVSTVPTADPDKPFVRLTRPGDVLGLTETLAKIPFRSTMRTITPCEFRVLDHDSLVRMLRNKPEVERQLLDALARDYADALQQLADVASCDHYHIPVDGAGLEWECNPKTPWIHRN